MADTLIPFHFTHFSSSWQYHIKQYCSMIKELALSLYALHTRKKYFLVFISRSCRWRCFIFVVAVCFCIVKPQIGSRLPERRCKFSDIRWENSMILTSILSYSCGFFRVKLDDFQIISWCRINFSQYILNKKLFALFCYQY